MLRLYGHNGTHSLYELIKQDADMVVGIGHIGDLYKLVNNEDKDIDRDNGDYNEIYKSIHTLTGADVDEDGVADTYKIKITNIDPVCKNYKAWQNKDKFCIISFEVVPVSSAGRRRSSKKRPTARRRRSSKRKARKSRATRRR